METNITLYRRHKGKTKQKQPYLSDKKANAPIPCKQDNINLFIIKMKRHKHSLIVVYRRLDFFLLKCTENNVNASFERTDLASLMSYREVMVNFVHCCTYANVVN